MPRFNVFRADPATTPQIGYTWLDAQAFIFQDCSTPCPTHWTPPAQCPSFNGCHLVSGGGVIAHTGINFVLGNGNGVWAYIDFPAGDYHDSFGRYRAGANTFPFAISPEGDIAIKPFSNQGMRLLHPDGTEEWMTDDDAQQVQILSGRRWLWMLGRQVQSNFTLIGKPLAEGCYGVQCAEDGTALYQALRGELVLGGHVIAPVRADYNSADVKLIGDTYWVTWAWTTADIPIDPPLHFTQAELDALPIYTAPLPIPPPAPPAPPPPVVVPPPAPPKPPPTPTPAPTPAPSTPFPAARPFAGVRMKVFAKVGHLYTGVPPTNSTAVYHDRVAGGAWEEIELTPQHDDYFDARYVAANLQLSIQNDGRLETRPAGTFGPFELLRATIQPDGMALLYRTDDGVIIGTPLILEGA